MSMPEKFRAQVYDNCFVFGDGTDTITSGNTNQFIVRATGNLGGGVIFYTTASGAPISSATTGGGDGSWNYIDTSPTFTGSGSAWMGSPPTNISDAISRIAATFGVGGIP